MPETFEVTHNKEQLQFEVALNGEKAILSYRLYKKDIAMMHTTVPKEMEGKGIASALARYAFQYAADQHKLVMVYCPFVSGFIKKHPGYRQQLDPEYHRNK